MFRWSALVVVLASTPAFAGDDRNYAEEAERLMGLDYDIDDVTTKARAAKPAAAPSHPGVPLPALPLEPNSTVDSVVVYRDRALVTRTREVKVDKGGMSITFEGLPLGVAADSLHAQARGSAVRIVGVELVSGTSKVEDGERFEQIRAEMLAVAEQLGQVRDRIESLLAQRAYLRETLSGSSDRPAPSLDQVKGTLTFVGQAERDIASSLRKEQEAAVELDKKLRPLLVKLENPLATGMTVRVDVEATSSAEADIALRYQVFGAGWTPSYNARLDPESDQVTVEYYGIVSQVTGEVWKDADLLLSTADPTVSGDLPRLQAWYLGRTSYGYDSGVLATLDSGGGRFENGEIERPAAIESMTGVVSTQMSAQVKGSGAVVFAIPGKRSIAGDGSSQRLPIGTQTFAAQLELESVPKLVPEVYRHARIRYAGEAPLLPGTVSSFVDGDYVGSGNIAAIVPGEELALAFGTDPSLEVTRQLVARQQESIGVGGRSTRHTFHFRIKVANFAPSAKTVMITDQIPVSEIDRVEVQLLDTSTPLDSSPEDPKGVLKWQVAVPANGQQVIDLRFSVTAPREVPMHDLEALF